MQPCVTAACGLFLPLLWKLLSPQLSNGRDCRNISQLLQQKVQPGQRQMPPGATSWLLTGQRAEDVRVPLAVPQGSLPSARMAATDGWWGRGDGLSQNAAVVSAVISSPHSFMSLCTDKAADVICPTSLLAQERHVLNSGGGSFCSEQRYTSKELFVWLTGDGYLRVRWFALWTVWGFHRLQQETRELAWPLAFSSLICNLGQLNHLMGKVEVEIEAENKRSNYFCETREAWIHATGFSSHIRVHL